MTAVAYARRPTSDSALRIQGLSVVFDGRAVLEGLDLDLGPGRVVCLLGRSGCGKTTLLRAVAGLQSLSAGTIALAGASEQPTKSRGVAMVFQADSLYPWLSAEQNVAFSVRSVGAPAKAALDRAQQELGRIGLGSCCRLRPRELSGGMRQRVNLARALATDPRVLLMDEPFSSLDYLTREEMQYLAGRLIAERGCTVLFVTHDVPEAVFLGDEIKILTEEARGIAHTIPVPWARPRDPSLKCTVEFQAIVAAAQRLIQ